MKFKEFNHRITKIVVLMVLLVGVIGPVGMVWSEKLHCSKHMCKHQKLSVVCPTAPNGNFCLVKTFSCCPDGKMGLVFLTESQRTLFSSSQLLNNWEKASFSDQKFVDPEISGSKWNGGSGTTLLQFVISHFKFIPIPLTKSSFLC